MFFRSRKREIAALADEMLERELQIHEWLMDNNGFYRCASEETRQFMRAAESKVVFGRTTSE